MSYLTINLMVYMSYMYLSPFSVMSLLVSLFAEETGILKENQWLMPSCWQTLWHKDP